MRNTGNKHIFINVKHFLKQFPAPQKNPKKPRFSTQHHPLESKFPLPNFLI